MSEEEPRLPTLRDAAERLSARIHRSDPNLPEPEILADELEAVTRMVEKAAEGDELPGDPDEEPSLLGLRFLDLLRAEVVRAWPDDPSSRPGAPDLLSLMRAFEDVRVRLSPEDPHLVGAPVLDPWARRLLGEMAHTLGSSMGPMVMLTEVLAAGESGEVNEIQKTQLRILYRAALAAGSMATDLLRLTGPFEEPEEGVAGVFSVPDLMEEVGAVLGPILTERGVEAKIGADEGTRSASGRVGRAFALRRALVALSFASMTDASGGTFTLEARGEDDEVRFVVTRDPPPPEDHLADEEPPAAAGPIFRERFQKRGWHVSPPALAIASARHLVHSLGGELTREEVSASGIGFSFSIPLPPVSEV